MKRLSLLLPVILLLGLSAASAHPGIGIVMDSKGNVYYTDLKHVWRISTDGTRSIVVRGIHTHELYLDDKDNLFGEHLWYEGERTDKWGHRVWRLSSDGNLVDIIPARQGFLENYDDFHFAHDGKGASYWTVGGEVTTVRKRSPDGKVTTLATYAFRNVRQMTVAYDGTVYLVDLHDLLCINPDGTVHTVVKNLAERRRSFLLTVDTHAIMGLWMGPNGWVYAAVPSDGAVKRVHPDGRVEIAARSSFGWKPSGGLVAPNGELWILEYSTINALRVRCIRTDGSSMIFD